MRSYLSSFSLMAFSFLCIAMLPAVSLAQLEGANAGPLKDLSKLPPYLYRVVYNIEFTRGGELKVQDSFDFIALQQIGGNSLPLAHEDELHELMRYFGSSANPSFYLLKIDTENITQIKHRQHIHLPIHGEFFAHVPIEAIAGVLKFRITDQNPPHYKTHVKWGSFQMPKNEWIEVSTEDSSIIDCDDLLNVKMPANFNSDPAAAAQWLRSL